MLSRLEYRSRGGRIGIFSELTPHRNAVHGEHAAEIGLDQNADRITAIPLPGQARSGDDARLSVARITKPGLKLLATIDPELDELMQSVTRPVSQAQLRQLARLCDALVP